MSKTKKKPNDVLPAVEETAAEVIVESPDVENPFTPDSLVSRIKFFRDEIAAIECDLTDVPRVATGYQKIDHFRDAAFAELALGRGWLGKALGVLGEEYPYPLSCDPTSPVVEPPSFTKPARAKQYANQIEGLKDLRARIQGIADGFGKKRPIGVHGFSEINTVPFIEYAIHHLANAKMLLGEDLGLFGGY